MQSKRSFTVEEIRSRSKGIKTKTGGRFISRTPFGAARKAFSQECRLSKIKGKCTFLITIRETTRGSKKKSYTYMFKRTKLNEPIKIKRCTKMTEIEIKYKTNGKPIKERDMRRLSKLFTTKKSETDKIE